MKSMFFVGAVLKPPFANGLAFQHSAALRVAEVSRARCVETPESWSDDIDEMIETATIIKEEVRDKRTSWMVHTRVRRVPTVRHSGKDRELHIIKIRQKADHDASTSCQALLTAVKVIELFFARGKAWRTIRATSCLCARHLVRKERALNERAQIRGRALDSVESFSCS